MSRTKLFVATGLAALAMAPAAEAAPTKQGTSTKQDCKKGQKKTKCGPPKVNGRFTGHGSISSTKYGTIHYETRNSVCNADRFPDLKVTANGIDFRLTSYSSPLQCLTTVQGGEVHPVAGFDTIMGQGTGTLNGVPGATIKFTLVDRGEPGRDDLASITIMSGGKTVLSITERTSDLGGNTQAHKSTT